MKYILEYQDSFWPDEVQSLLLKAIFAGPDDALRAWEQWKDSFNLMEEHIDTGTFRLFPLLYRRLAGLGVRDDRLGTLKGVYRNTWYKNQHIFHDLKTIIGALDHAGIPSIVLKGAALSLHYYRERGCRAMDDADLLVRPEKIRRAVEVLEGLGFEATVELPRAFDFEHAVPLKNSRGFSVDLHQYIMHECCHTDGDRDFWTAALKTEYDGLVVTILDEAAILLHTLIHGLRPQTSIHWIADAVVLIRSMDSEEKWDRFITYAGDRRLAYQAGIALNYLAGAYCPEIPPAVLARLSEIPVSAVERFEYRCKIATRGVLGVLPEAYSRYYLRLTRGNGQFSGKSFLEYLRYYFSCESTTELFTTIIRKGFDNIGETCTKRLRKQ